ncbi:MAG: hypothetical protein AAGB13_09940, partial [Cyanobacteria bacterium P01_F01_bin.33]
LTILNAIRNYPLTELRVNLDSVLYAAEDIQDILISSDRLFAYIENKASAGVTSVEEFLAKVPDPILPGDLEWSVTTVTVTNPERDLGDDLLVDLYLPKTSKGSSPLVVISHGVASSRKTFSYVAEHLASYGFAVAAIEHPNTDASSLQQYIAGFEDGADPRDAIQRPSDITAVLDFLERKDENNNSDWTGKVETDGVGVLGQSLGGYTVLAAGGAQLNLDYLEEVCSDSDKTILPFNLSLLLQCETLKLPSQNYVTHDQRIKAVLAINPVSSAVFGPAGLEQIQVPVLMIASSNDILAPAVEEQIEPFSWLKTEEKYLLLVKNGTHFSFLPGESGGGEDVFSLPEALVGPDPKQAHPVIKAISTVFFQTYINESDEYELFLTEAFLSAPEGDEFKFALTGLLSESEIAEVLSNPRANED